MTQQKNNKPVPKKNLQVTVYFNPETKDLTDYITAAGIEHYGIWMELKRISKKKFGMIFLFDKVVNGEDFFNVFNGILEVEKEECLS